MGRLRAFLLFGRPTILSRRRRILVQGTYELIDSKYQSAGSVLQVLGPCMNSNDVILATHRDSSLRSE